MSDQAARQPDHDSAARDTTGAYDAQDEGVETDDRFLKLTKIRTEHQIR